MTTTEERYNEKYASILSQIAAIMNKKGEAFRAKAYQKAENAILSIGVNISSVKQLKEMSIQGVGKTIEDKLDEYMRTGTVRLIEENKLDPANIFADIYGIGPKKAQELVKLGITNMQMLENRKMEVLNDVQRIGLKYNADIQERIPRIEIDMYKKLLNGRGEIVGSYRRGANTSGDIDIIFKTKKEYKELVEDWKNRGVIVEVLSSGESKTLVIAKLVSNSSSLHRRIDFLYAAPEEYAFAILYFTGSKVFNTQMRQNALNKGYTFNEHGIYKLTENGIKGDKVDRIFMEEKDIFDFLNLKYVEPTERSENKIVEIENNNNANSFKAKPATPKLRLKKNNITKKNTLERLYLTNFRKKGIDFLKSICEKDLKGWIVSLDDAYHNKGSSVLTDVEYDIIRDYYNSKYGSSKVGAEIPEKHKKSVLPYEMASMNKIKMDSNVLNKWKNEYSSSVYVVSSKLDGVSALYTSINGIDKLYTRGDGKVGQDISELIPHLKMQPSSSSDNSIVIRGELVMKRATFSSKYAGTYANGRNMVAGLINQNVADCSSISDVDFVAYEVIEPAGLTPLEQLKFLSSEKLKLNVVNSIVASNSELTTEWLSSSLLWTRENSEYDVDGLVVSSNAVFKRGTGNPLHAFAFKMVLTEQVCEARVVDVIWTASKDGYLKPRVQIEPVKLGGVVIEYATGFNGKFIKENSIGVGAVIELVRSGDVIPHIQKVIVVATEGKMPAADVIYEWNESGVDIVVSNMSSNLDVLTKNISGFFRGLKVEGLSEGNVLRLIKGGYDSVEKIIQAKEGDISETVGGFGEKMSKKVCGSIKHRIANASLVEIMTASNVFGRGFSDKKIETIISTEPSILISSETLEEKVAKVENIRGFSKKTAEAFVSRIEDFVKFMERCGLNDKLYIDNIDKENSTLMEEKDIQLKHPLFNKNVVMTGARDKKVMEYLKKIGASIVGSVSKNTSLIIAKDINTDTGKAEEGKKLGIPVISLEAFCNTYNI